MKSLFFTGAQIQPIRPEFTGASFTCRRTYVLISCAFLPEGRRLLAVSAVCGADVFSTVLFLMTKMHPIRTTRCGFPSRCASPEQ